MVAQCVFFIVEKRYGQTLLSIITMTRRVNHNVYTTIVYGDQWRAYIYSMSENLRLRSSNNQPYAIRTLLIQTMNRKLYKNVSFNNSKK